MKRLFVFPYSKDTAAILRYSNLLKNYDTVIPVGLSGMGVVGQDASVVDGGPSLGITVIPEIEFDVSDEDAVLLTTCEEYDFSAKDYRQMVEFLHRSNMKVILTEEVSGFLDDGLRESAVYLKRQTEMPQMDEHKNLLKIRVPVITVFGSGPNCDKFETQLLLNKLLQEQGVRVSHICTKELGALFGMTPIPQFMFDGSVSSLLKIKAFNQFAYDLVRSEKPDVLVLGIPGGIMPLNPYDFSEFGEMAFLMNFAVPCDYGILTLYNQEYPEKATDALIELCRYRFNATVKAVNLTNKILFIPQDEKNNQYFVSSFDDQSTTVSISEETDAISFRTYEENSHFVLQEHIMQRLKNEIFEDQ